MFNYVNGLQPSGYAVTAFGATPTLSSIGIFVLNILIGVGFSVCLLAAGYSAVMFTLSKGDPKGTARAWNALLWALYSGLIILAAMALKQAVIIAPLGITMPELINDAPGY